MSNVKEYTKEYLEKHIKPLLKVGASIKIGKHYADEIGGFKSGEVITLIEGHFDYDNGLYTETQKAPSVWNEDTKEFDSIYHLFGNHLENFFDCEVLTPPTMTNNQLPAEVQERIKADAERYAGVMVWVNQDPEGNLPLFHEFISITSYIAGATAENEKAQAEIDRRNKLLKDDLKRQCRLNMPGISEQDQEAAWQAFKAKHNL